VGALNAGDRDQHIAEKRYLHADGREIWASINISVVRDQDEETDVFFAQMVDITERKEREAVLRAQLSELSWLGDITRAIAEDRFELHAQPIVDLSNRELLLRLRAPGGELVAPADFLPAAEKYGSVREIDRWVISRGAELASRGQNVEINLSAVSLADPGLIAHIVDELARTDADPARLVFEITETALLSGAETAIHLANQLRTRGCRFALDDFGTGYAGFHYLKALPLDFLKIDREFVRDPVTHEPDHRVIEAVVGLARGFGLRTIAEGVEDESTFDLLKLWGVDLAQGYHLGHPTPIELG
jgi:EAL domain-containing protein (putative c-di-GMP-specific phosphodiesterase class I)